MGLVYRHIATHFKIAPARACVQMGAFRLPPPRLWPVCNSAKISHAQSSRLYKLFRPNDTTGLAQGRTHSRKCRLSVQPRKRNSKNRYMINAFGATMPRLARSKLHAAAGEPYKARSRRQYSAAHHQQSPLSHLPLPHPPSRRVPQPRQ